MAKPILLIEDDIACRKLIVRRLKLAGVESVEAGSGEEGLLILNKQDILAIFLNLNLPGISGEDMIPIIKDRWPLIPIVVITGYDDPDRRADLYADGAVRIIPKPYEEKHITEFLAFLRDRNAIVNDTTSRFSHARANWRTSLGGAIGVFGTALMGVGMLGITGEPDYHRAIYWYISLAGFILSCAGKAIDSFFAADACQIRKIAEKAVQDNATRISNE